MFILSQFLPLKTLMESKKKLNSTKLIFIKRLRLTENAVTKALHKIKSHKNPCPYIAPKVLSSKVSNHHTSCNTFQ